MAAIASVISIVWPGILGAAVTAILIYLSLRGLEWPADVDGSTGQEAGATSQRLG